MPIECRVPFNARASCNECRNHWEGMCEYDSYTPIPVEEILSPKELIQYYITKKRKAGIPQRKVENAKPIGGGEERYNTYII